MEKPPFQSKSNRIFVHEARPLGVASIPLTPANYVIDHYRGIVNNCRKIKDSHRLANPLTQGKVNFEMNERDY